MRELVNRCVFLDRHSGTPFPMGLVMQPSYLRAYLDSETFRQSQKVDEGKQNLAAAQVQRLDAVVKAIGNLSKMLRR